MTYAMDQNQDDINPFDNIIIEFQNIDEDYKKLEEIKNIKNKIDELEKEYNKLSEPGVQAKSNYNGQRNHSFLFVK